MIAIVSFLPKDRWYVAAVAVAASAPLRFNKSVTVGELWALCVGTWGDL